MAIDNKKMKDPTEAALSAVEHALNLDDLHGSMSDAPRVDHVSEPRLPDVDDHDFANRPFRDLDAEHGRPDPRLRPLEDRANRTPFLAPDRDAVANDDSRNAGVMLQALQIRPSRAAYVWATLASLLWIGAAAGVLYTRGITTPQALFDTFAYTQLAIGAFVVMTPVVFFYVAAIMAVRSQEMKLVARAVGEVAMRLAQPETFSTDAVLSVSQAVRREIAAVGDGVERALARAGELETLVRSEISTLERAYSDNEIRIR
ncbi:MAG: hypothetical protein ABWY78_23035, partial [Microvirga sp.]